MGQITTDNTGEFKSAEFIYSKIKREWKSFGIVNLIDDADFPLYTAEVLRELKRAAYKEESAMLMMKDGKCKIPSGFMSLHSAYRCGNSTVSTCTDQLQRKTVGYIDRTSEFFGKSNKCEAICGEGQLVEKITTREYIKEGYRDYSYDAPRLLRLSPQFFDYTTEGCPNRNVMSGDELSINNGYFFNNFGDGEIYIQYYAFPYDENNLPLIPNSIEIEKAIEWYIKYQLLLTYWLNDELQNALNKWQKAEQEYEKWMAAARHQSKLPSFNTMVNSLRRNRKINKVSFFSQIDKRR